jgi:hypothetical protein
MFLCSWTCRVWIDRYVASEHRLNGWKVIQLGVFLVLSPHWGVLKKVPLQWISRVLVAKIEFLPASWTDWANSHELLKCYSCLLKLEIPNEGPILGVFCENNPLEVCVSVRTFKGHFIASNRVVWRIDRQNRPSGFCWARCQVTNEKKPTESLQCRPFVGRTPSTCLWDLSLEEFPWP